MLARHVAIGPMGPFGMLSPPDCYSPVLLGALLALMGCCLHVFLTMLTRLAGILLLALVGRPGLCPGSLRFCDPGGRTLLPGDGGPKFCPDVLEDDLVLGAAVPLPAVKDS